MVEKNDGEECEELYNIGVETAEKVEYECERKRDR